MTPARAVPDVDRIAARAALLAELDRHAIAGRVAPCLRWPLAGWTSDDEAEQALAARLCPACPALAPCHAYGLEHPTERGVYGASTEHERRPSLGRPRKTTETAEEREAS